MRRNTMRILGIWMILLSLSQGVFAACLTVDPGDYGPMLTGSKLTLYRVGTDGAEGIELTADFQNSGITLTEENLPYGAELLESYALEAGFSGEERWIGKEGTVSFENLETGIYLVAQHQNTPDDISIIPVLIRLPEEGSAVTAFPKVTAPTVTLPEPALPQTGQRQWPVAVMLGMGILLILAGLVIRKYRTPMADE